jgi:hypothetical protein
MASRPSKGEVSVVCSLAAGLSLTPGVAVCRVVQFSVQGWLALWSCKGAGDWQLLYGRLFVSGQPAGKRGAQ